MTPAQVVLERVEADSLTVQQARVLRLVVQYQLHVFVTGGAGRGKIYVLASVLTALAAVDRRAVVVSSTWMGARHVHRTGTTLHSAFKIPTKTTRTKVPPPWEVQRRVREFIATKKGHELMARKWKQVDVLVMAENNMAAAHCVWWIHFLLVELRNDTAAFGGLQLVVVADYMQLPPIEKWERGHTNEHEGYFAFQQSVWPVLVPVELTEPQRHHDTEWAALCDRVRLGQHTDADKQRLALLANTKFAADVQPLSILPRRRAGSMHSSVDEVNKEYFDKLDTPIMLSTATAETRFPDGRSRSTLPRDVERVLRPELMSYKFSTRVS